MPNGLRCVHIPSTSEVEYLGVAVNVGSRDDAAGLEGLAHFVEHTIFKGTARRKSWHIINRMESCGGELNAYTTKETTVVYSVFPTGNTSKAADLIADLITESLFPQREIDREREVVADEISSYLDIPSESIYDDFEDIMFQGTGLGHNILGNKESLNRFTPEICRRYLSDYYTAPNMVLFYSGQSSPDQMVRMAMRYFQQLPAGQAPLKRIQPMEATPFDIEQNRHIHQAHTIIGTVTPGMFSPQRHAIALAANIIGGPGMNSMLNVELREKRGLVYSVEASCAMMTDCGLFSLYFGCDPEDLARCRRIISGTMSRLADSPLSPIRLAKAKKQYLGQITVAGDNRESSVLSAARAVLYHGRPLTPAQRAEIVQSLTADDLMQAARLLAPSGLSTLIFR